MSDPTVIAVNLVTTPDIQDVVITATVPAGSAPLQTCIFTTFENM